MKKETEKNQNILLEPSAEEYILSESQELNVAENPWIVSKILSAFPAFKHKNYRLYFTGQLISLVGTWLQMVAQGWLVFELTHSAFWVGLVSAIGSLPVLIFSLYGGVIVDRLPKKNILLFTQTSSMVLAFILGLLTVLNIINVTEIVILSFLLGTVNALDMPARQVFVVELVGKKDLTSAIALNSGIFNGARVIGPGIAGIIIASIGTGGAFILNALSYIAAVIALVFISVKTTLPNVHPNPFTAIKEGINYSFSNKTIRLLLLSTAMLSIFGWSYTTIMPVIVSDIFHQKADMLGYFYSSAGLGAILGVILVSSLSKKVSNVSFIIGGNFLFVLSIFLFTLSTSLPSAFVFLFFAGLGLIAQFSMINTTIQHVVPDNIRGRVMSIYTLMFLGMIPVGSFQIGFFAEHFGSFTAIRLGLIILALFGIFLYTRRGEIKF